jgi:iron complex outermembrane receptor protein
MKIIGCILFALFLNVCLKAQQSIIKEVKLQIIDAQSGKHIPYATLRKITSATDSTQVSIYSADKNGKIIIQIANGEVLKASAIGYSESSLKYNSSQVTPAILIALVPAARTLNQVNIITEKKSVELMPGGYRINLAKANVNTSGNMLETLRQLPGLTVDGSENIKLQGKTPLVLLNGRRVNLMGQDLAVYLKSLGVNQLSEVEISTSPNAQYDVDGEGGVINLKLRKSMTGLFGNISSNFSTLRGSDQNGSLNYKTGKWDLSASYNFTYREDLYRRDNQFLNKSLPDSLYRFEQLMLSEQFQRGHSLRSGINFSIDTSSSISGNVFAAWFHSGVPWNTRTQIFNSQGIFQRQYLQDQYNNTNNRFAIYDLTYQKKFRNQLQLTAAFNLSDYNNRNSQDYSRNFYDQTLQPEPDTLNERRLIYTARPYQMTVSSIDMNKPIGQSSRLEAGAKLSTTRTDSYFQNSVYNFLTSQFQSDVTLNSQLLYNEHIVGSYLIFSSRLNKMNFQLGLRHEYFSYHFKASYAGEEMNNSYSSFFPGINISFRSKDQKSGYSINMNRRIQRPGYSILNPFVNVAQIGQYIIGNPNLKPYFINKAELQFSRSYQSNFFMAAIFGSHASDIYSAVFKYDPVLKMNVDTYDNIRNLSQYGFYLIGQNKISSWLNLNTYISGTQSVFATRDSQDILLPDNFSLTGNISLNFKVFKKMDLQLYGYCVTTSNYFQVQNKTTGNISFSIQQKMLKDKLTASLTVEDIFNITRYPIGVYNPNVDLYSINKNKTRYARIALSYAFGKSYTINNKKDLRKDNRTD